MRRMTLLMIPVMGSALDDLYASPVDAIDDAVVVVDPPTPPAGQVVFQGLRLADALVSVAINVLQEAVDPLKRLAVLPLPVKVVLPGIVVP